MGMQFSFPFPALTPRSLTIARRAKENAENFLSASFGTVSYAFLRPAAVVDQSRGLVAITLVATRHLNATRSLALLMRPENYGEKHPPMRDRYFLLQAILILPTPSSDTCRREMQYFVILLINDKMRITF